MNKKLKIAYWTATIIFALWLLLDGIGGVSQVAAGKTVVASLGYPFYILTITGSAKILAAVAVVQNKFKTIKEWAFAGYAIDCMGASLSQFFVGGHIGSIIFPLIFLVLMFIPYYLWKKYTIALARRT